MIARWMLGSLAVALAAGQAVAAEPAPDASAPPPLPEAPAEDGEPAPAAPQSAPPTAEPAALEPIEGPPAPAEPGQQSPIFEPPPPGLGVVREPPPPPRAHHVAPRSALVLGARAGWFLPFGSLYSRARPPDRQGLVLREPVPWSSYASSGLALELDVGARVARSYTVFALWERAQLGGGSADRDLYGEQTGADSDFWAAAVRASSDADHLGFLTEIAVGYRQARTHFNDGSKLELTGASFAGRLGVGVEYRVNQHFAFSPLATIGVGSFGRVRRVTPSGAGYDAIGPRDDSDSHAWLTLTVAAHVDLAGSRER